MATAHPKPDDLANKWINTIAVYEREFKKWEQRVEKIQKRYRDEGRSQNIGVRFNILWANVQTALPAVFSRLPQPDVSRRHKDTDPVGRVAALLLERALEFETSHYPDYRAAMRQCVQDRFLGGRGVSWVRYEPSFKTIPPGESEDGDEVTEDIDEPPKSGGPGDEAEPTEELAEELDNEHAACDYVHWRDFGHTVARTWEEVTGVWRRVFMGRDALVKRFGAIGKTIPLDTKPEDLKKTSGADQSLYEAVIYEIWDKSTGNAMWLSKTLGKFIDEKPDPLHLDEFWPCAKPLYATLTNDSLIPIPDFTIYQDQAMTLDVIAERIEGLVKALQVKGCYDASIPELGRIFTEGNNTSLIPVKNWQAFAEKQGLAGALSLVDLTPIFNALKALYEAAEQQKNQVYELMGLADIIRGSTDPNETATAQELKGNFGSMRLRSMQADVAQFATELLQIQAQIICGKFQPETIAQIGGAQTLSEDDQQFVQDAVMLLKNASLRDFRIEIVADSMIYMDEVREKQDRMEMLTATGGFLKEAVPAATQSPELAPLLMEMLKFGVTGFKVGKTLEGAFDTAADQLKQAAANPQPKPDPEMAKIQAESQARAQELQVKSQSDQQALQAKQQYDQFKANLDAQVEQAKQQAQAQQEAQQEQLEAARAQQEAQLKAQVDAHKASLDAQTESARLDFERYKADLDAKVKIAVAEIAANASLQAAQQKAAQDEITGEAIKDEKAAKPTNGSAGPPIHIHLPSGNKKIKKNDDGSYQSEDA